MKTRSVKIILMAAAMLGAGLFNSCDSDDDAAPVVKTELVASVAAANLLLTTSIEGVGTGNYVKGSKAPLEAAVAAAQAVVDDATATQAVVTNATVALAAAVTVYEGQKVVPIDPTNLVGQWTFDELTSVAAGTAVKDYSGKNFNGAIKAGHSTLGSVLPVLTADRYNIAGKALKFDKGANVEIPYNTALNPPAISISVWVKLNATRNNRFIGLHSWIGYKFEVQDANVPFGTIGHTGGSYDRNGGVTLNNNQWYHLVMTHVAGTMVFYVDGIPVKTETDVPNPAVSISGKPYNLVLGQDFPTDKYVLVANDANFNNVAHADYHVIPLPWGGYLNGSLDEVRIYKTALTASQVTSIYNTEKP
jgi:hypothetical protein